MTNGQNSIRVKFSDGRQVTCDPHQSLKDLIAEQDSPAGLPYLGAVVNNDVVSLSYPLEVDSDVRLVTLTDPYGWRIYRQTVSFLLAKSVKELFPSARFSVEHSLGTGFYCNFEMNGSNGISQEQLTELETHMRELARRDVPIVRMKISYQQAVAQFHEENQRDKLNLLRFRNPPKVVIYCCEGFSDIAHGPLADRTGPLDLFRLISYPPGFVIQFPDREEPTELAPFEKQPHLFDIFKEHKEWGRILGVQTVGDLNEIIMRGEVNEFIRISEGLHEKKITQLADQVHARRDQIRWIFIAGPSSAGKTTTSKRLSVQLKVSGLRPVILSVDDYFVDREKTPLTETGEYDFENIETIDLELLNDHLDRLDRGEEVELPRFNFHEGKREFRGDRLHIEKDQLVVVEGIHCLNPRLSEAVPQSHKLKIYISALTQLNLDSNNRISTTDNRLIRRMVRDNMFRGNSALMTLQMWPNVRKGEKTWIFPYQHEADLTLNSALDYEIAVLKRFAEPLLAEVKPDQPQYAEARRLQEFISSFLGISAGAVPPSSILREFIGRSSFRY